MSLPKLNPSSPVGTSDDGQPETSGCATIGDVPPEILTLILEYLLNGKRNSILSYRLINSEWKSIIDSHLEKKMVSGVFQPFPEMKLECDPPSKFHADCCPTLFCEGRNPFPFNSLFADGMEEPGREWYFHLFEVPNALQDFGANLSSFALSYHQLGIDQLASMLGWMPCLKRLSLCYVHRENDYSRREVVIPSPPPLPFLNSLELKVDGILYRGPCLWLVISYADQLVQLSIESIGIPFEPLRKQYQYRDSFSGNIIVGVTSSPAFGKLKELTICRPSREFLELSDSPALQHLSVTNIEIWRLIGLQDLIKFINGCSNTLHTLFVGVNWDDWADNGERSSEMSQPKRTAAKLKTITIRYPKGATHKRMLERSSLLKLKPDLEVLELIHFENEQDARLMDPNYNELYLEIHSCDEEERAELKQQLASLDKREAVLQGKLNVVLLRQQETRKVRRIAAEAARKGGAYGWPQLAAERRLIIQQWKENVALRRQIDFGLQEKAPLLQRLYVLNRKAAIARELRELGIWSCPKLEVVSVSSGDKVSGDICVIRKVNAVGPP